MKLSVEEIEQRVEEYLDIVRMAEYSKGNKKTDACHWFSGVLEELRKLKKRKGRLFFIGNGASSSIASHFAADFTKRAGIPAFSNNDGALLTCFSNDISFESAYSEILKLIMNEGDGLIAISSSGKSPNIINAARMVKKNFRGCPVITLSGFRKDNPLRRTGDYNLYLSTNDYGCAESGHAYYVHLILDLFSTN